MRKLALLALLVPGLAVSQVSLVAGVRIDLPRVLPALVVVTPGVQVVPEVGHEVFLVNGFYWAREGDVWYRSRSHRGGWVVAPARIVPASIHRIPPGHYKRWKPAKGHWHEKKGRHDHHGHDRGRHGEKHRHDDRGDHDRHDHGRRDGGDRHHDDHGGRDDGRGAPERGWKDKGGR